MRVRPPIDEINIKNLQFTLVLISAGPAMITHVYGPGSSGTRANNERKEGNATNWLPHVTWIEYGENRKGVCHLDLQYIWGLILFPKVGSGAEKHNQQLPIRNGMLFT